MPEGPEVRKYADALNEVLAGKQIKHFMARTVNARKWLEQNGSSLRKRKVSRVLSHGKHLIGYIDGDYYFHSHLMMWGRWQTFKPTPPAEIDRRERARIVVTRGAAILYSAPVFNVGQGDPYKQVEYLDTLGPDVLPYDKEFDAKTFLLRIKRKEYREVTIGAALLDQRISAGIGNYLRAEILFACRMNPWRLVRELSKEDFQCLVTTISELAKRAYKLSATAPLEDRERMKEDTTLVYQPGREYGTRHLVFRRTNLPCLRCATPIKQLRQLTISSGDEERDRIVYFCSRCQSVD